MAKRESLQKQIDNWHLANSKEKFNKDDYTKFLKSISYLSEEGDDFEINSFLDFTFQEVRDYICEVAIEIVRSFDLDGLELCFRESVYFPYGKGRESQSIMTDLIRQIHEILVTESQIKKKELKLGARVFQTLKIIEINIKSKVGK